MKQILRDANYDQLIISNQVDLNQQRRITLMNVSEDFFETSINIAPKIKDSLLYPIRTFLNSHCKVMAVERIEDKRKLGKYILILDDQDYPSAIEKLSKLFDSLQKKNQLPTIKSSL